VVEILHRVFLQSFDLNKRVTIAGNDASHMIKSLRMKRGEVFVLCDGLSNEWLCEITEILKDKLSANVLEKRKCLSEPKTKVSLFVSVPKGDKMEEIIQKAVELGVFEIHPVLSGRCVSRPDSQSALKKLERWRAVSKSAAMQSDRGIIPKVFDLVSFETAVNTGTYDRRIILYEVPEKTTMKMK
jgi:16S rRNA (uracil1498-N3)-methyltransferase